MGPVVKMKNYKLFKFQVTDNPGEQSINIKSNDEHVKAKNGNDE